VTVVASVVKTLGIRPAAAIVVTTVASVVKTPGIRPAAAIIVTAAASAVKTLGTRLAAGDKRSAPKCRFHHPHADRKGVAADKMGLSRLPVPFADVGFQADQDHCHQNTDLAEFFD
jgi:hypothetical protein